MRKLLTVTSAVLFLLSFAFGQAFNLNGNGARAAGMGYAFTGIADDATAIAWNPAGLVTLESMELFVIGRLGFASSKTEYDDGTGFWINYDDEVFWVKDGDYSTESQSEFNFNFASVAFPITIGDFKLVPGVAYRNLYDFNDKRTHTSTGDYEKLNYSSNSWETTYDAEYKGINETIGGVNAISPSFGLRVNDMVSLGATYNIFTGSYGRKGSTTLNGNELYNFDNDPIFDYKGNSIDVGFMLKPGDFFSIGGSFSLPHTLTWVFKEIDAENDLKIPLFYNVGVGLHLTDNLLFSADYHARPWSKAEWDEGGDSFSDYDVNSIHAGLEYILISGESILPIRLGYFTQPTLNEDANGDQIKTNAFTGGIGLVFGNFVIDGAVEWAQTSYLDTKFESGKEINFSGNRIKVTIGATIYFGR